MKGLYVEEKKLLILSLSLLHIVVGSRTILFMDGLKKILQQLMWKLIQKQMKGSHRSQSTPNFQRVGLLQSVIKSKILDSKMLEGCYYRGGEDSNWHEKYFRWIFKTP
ncbi:hypothetical protein HanRHA438_Chr05g0220431 [Helianthus annuus]|uniref:Uncharacterized protein n=1 Tax=Helianthus annuus TaxID=4232 RepID=A0A251UPG9_HELAN|nr:hypothetical protein HanXRQr2_Chr05g0210771 [Helianthus annuus]KAJ0569974.1 hypothetical protein HanHA300_Chr05g0172751 [Helianthus annuus]KAJ0576670.1 hypothetical protein HanIR_Chr05g0227031 [Helianthus annuus]KAJ0584304.1 hypothetical protein HanHA89_Chr05g0187021 [Helianthus annuus]KAJ0746937.1 hypothetical protein HanOQP8_Chr05g0183641 [Helianthus annuus]